MEENSDRAQTQETLQRVADEFLALYLHSGHINGFCFTSRLFIMGHTLELFVKSRLVPELGMKPLASHRLHEYVVRINPEFALSPEVLKAGSELYATDLTNFSIGLHDKHREELELYLAYYHLPDLKYYISKSGQVIFPAISNTVQFNRKYLAMIGAIRREIPIPNRTMADARLKGLFEYLGLPEKETACVF